MTIYEEDILAWSETQANLLRRLAASIPKGGEHVNDEIDWENVIEEVESVGNEQLHAVNSLLRQALLHMLKARAWPNSRDVPHWQAESRTFLSDAADRFTPSMRQRIDLDKIYRRALKGIPDNMDGIEPLPLPKNCPMTLDELLSDE